MMQQSGSENLYVSSEKKHDTGEVARPWVMGTQALYYWQTILLKKCSQAQIPCLPPFSC